MLDCTKAISEPEKNPEKKIATRVIIIAVVMLMVVAADLKPGRYRSDCHGVLGEIFVAYKAGAFEHMGGILDMHEGVGIDLTGALVPEDSLRQEQVAGHFGYLDISVESPQAFVFEISGGVGCHGGDDLHTPVILAKIDPLRETPIGLVDLIVYLPKGGDDAILRDAGVGDQRRDIVGGHRRHPFGLERSGDIDLRILAASAQDRSYAEHKEKSRKDGELTHRGKLLDLYAGPVAD